MRLLIDEDVDIRVIREMKRLGHDVKRVPTGMKNGAVISLAQKERRVLITRDADFTDSNRYPPTRFPGIIHLDIHPPRLSPIAMALKRLMATVSEADFSGKLFILDETAYADLP